MDNKYSKYVKNEFSRLLVARLVEHDALCEKCLKLPVQEKLCEGMRQYIDERNSTHTIRTVTSACSKRREQLKLQVLENRYKACGVPERIVNELLLRVEGREPNLKDGVYRLSPESLRMAWQVVVDGIGEGENNKYLYMGTAANVYKDRLDIFPQLYLENCDLLVVHGLGMTAGVGYALDSIEAVIEMRILSNLTTYVILSEVSAFRTSKSKELYEMVKKCDLLKI